MYNNAEEVQSSWNEIKTLIKSNIRGYDTKMYNESGSCPGCGDSVKEDNYHYIMKCSRYKTLRTDMFKKLHHIFKILKIKPTIKILLGFPENTRDLKNEMFIRLREIIFYQLGKYIQLTERFSKSKWIIPFLKA